MNLDRCYNPYDPCRRLVRRAWTNLQLDGTRVALVCSGPRIRPELVAQIRHEAKRLRCQLIVESAPRMRKAYYVLSATDGASDHEIRTAISQGLEVAVGPSNDLKLQQP